MLHIIDKKNKKLKNPYASRIGGKEASEYRARKRQHMPGAGAQ